MESNHYLEVVFEVFHDNENAVHVVAHHNLLYMDNVLVVHLQQSQPDDRTVGCTENCHSESMNNSRCPLAINSHYEPKLVVGQASRQSPFRPPLSTRNLFLILRLQLHERIPRKNSSKPFEQQ